MADTATSVPKYDELLWPTLDALKALGGSGKVDEIYYKVVELGLRRHDGD
ncbi:MAG: hypothetical protein HYY05_07330 [Chloroflexi bacterium]|nr:hypothetical protein [Chloroflexota bacterium]